jgi:hypothetical protein
MAKDISDCINGGKSTSMSSDLLPHVLNVGIIYVQRRKYCQHVSDFFDSLTKTLSYVRVRQIRMKIFGLNVEREIRAILKSNIPMLGFAIISEHVCSFQTFLTAFFNLATLHIPTSFHLVCPTASRDPTSKID